MATDIRIKYSIDTEDIAKAQAAFDKLTQEEQDALNKLKLLNDELGDTGDEAAKAAKKLKELGASDSLNSLKAKADQLRSELNKLSPTTDKFKAKLKELKAAEKDLGGLQKATSGVGGGIQNILSKLGPVGGAIAGAFTISAVVGFAKSIFDVTAKFQKLEAVMVNTLGSTGAAYAAMNDIKEFAKTTPFSVEELTSSFVKLANQGFRPTSDEMRKLGDLASSTGKSFDQLAEAVIDAQVGEFERLKEFGVRAQKHGDMITFSFKGVETQVRNNNEAIQQYLVSLGDYEGVAGSAAAVSGTLGGKVNNLGDAWDNFLVNIGESLGPILADALEVTAEFMDKIGYLFAQGRSDAKKYKEMEGEIYKENKEKRKYEDMLEEDLAARKAQYTEGLADAKKYLAEAQKTTQYMTQWEKDFQMKSPIYWEHLRDAVQMERTASEEIAHYQANLSNIEDEYKARQDEIIAKNKKFDEEKKRSWKELEEWVANYNKKKKEEEDARKKEEEDAKQRAKERQAAIEKEYEQKVKNINIEKQITAEKIKQKVAPEDQAIAQKELEMAANIELLKIANQYKNKRVEAAKEQAKILPEIIKTQNKEITQDYITQGNEASAAFTKAIVDRQMAEQESATKLNESNLAAIKKREDESVASMEAEAIKMGEVDDEFKKKQIQNQINFNNEKIAENERAYDDGVYAAKDANDEIINENLKLQAQLIAIDKETQAKKKEITLAGVELASQITSQSFALYQANLQAEMSSLTKRYDEEIRLADGNKQKITELNEKKAAQEREIKKKQFYAQRYEAIAQVIFNTAPIIAKYGAAVFTAPLALIALATQAAQIGFIMAQPVPEFAEGTKGRKFRGGRAMVGERGTERIVTESGKVYYTPPTATLMDLPQGSQVVPNHLLSKQEIAYASMSRNTPSGSSFDLGGKLTEIGGILKGLPIHQIVMDEKGFQKFIKTENRTTKVLNNKFPQAYS